MILLVFFIFQRNESASKAALYYRSNPRVGGSSRPADPGAKVRCRAECSTWNIGRPAPRRCIGCVGANRDRGARPRSANVQDAAKSAAGPDQGAGTGIKPSGGAPQTALPFRAATLPSVPRGTSSGLRLQSRASLVKVHNRALNIQKCPAMARILCLGMSALDAIYRVPAIPSTPTKVLASGFIECGGGMAANASVAVARLGGQASYWGRLGADDRGTRILHELSGEGVDVSTVRRVPGAASPADAILVDDAGERLVCAYLDPRLDPDPSWLPLDRVGQFDAVLADVRWPLGAAAVFDSAVAAGIPAVFDGDVGPRDALRDLAARATHVVFSEPGLAVAAGVEDPGEGLARVARALSCVVGVRDCVLD